MPEGITKRSQRISDKVGDKVFGQSLDLLKKSDPTPWYGDKTNPAERLVMARAIVADPQAIKEMHRVYDKQDGLPDTLDLPPDQRRVNIRFRRDIQAMSRMVIAADGHLPQVVQPPAPVMPTPTVDPAMGDGAVQTADAAQPVDTTQLPPDPAAQGVE